MPKSFFPIRLLGFSFYWAWLFLVCVSPSLLLGRQEVAGVPLEAAELAVRLLVMVILLIAFRHLPSKLNSKLLLAISMLMGTGASVVAVAGQPEIVFLSVLLMGCADASMFLMWLCFFGNRRTGEIAGYFALSYALGALLALLISFFELHIGQFCAVLLPVFSGISYQLSYQHYRVENALAEDNEEDGAHEEHDFRGLPYLRRLGSSLALYAMIFGVATSTAFVNWGDLPLHGPQIEAPCALVTGVALAFLFGSVKRASTAYRAYRVTPIVMGVGIALQLIGHPTARLAGCACIMLGYLVFEILALNDFCNAIKMRGLSPLRMIGAARICISAGMLMGWFVGIASSQLSNLISPEVCVVLVCLPILLIASTLVFTEKEVFAVRETTDERIIREGVESGGALQYSDVLQAASDIQETLISEFGHDHGLSPREMEVLPLLLSGKTAVYISEQLVIAPGTVKTHVYNIYQKLSIHTKMELFSTFESYCKKSR